MSVEQDELSGFGNVFSNEPTQAVASDEELVSTDEEVVESPEEVVEEVLQSLSPEEFRALAERVDSLGSMPDELRKVQGKYGELHRTIQQLQQQRPGVQLSPDKLTRLSEQYPDLAELLAGDLNDAFSGSQTGQAAFDSGAVEQLFNERLSAEVAKMEQAQEMKLLTIQHRDWRKVVESQEFSQWKDNLPEEERTALDTTWDSEFIADKLSEYKESRKAPVPVEVPRVSAKTKVIQAAVTPTGSRTPMPAANSEVDEFNKAIASVFNRG